MTGIKMKIKLYMLFRLNVVSCVVLIPHYNGLLKIPVNLQIQSKFDKE